MYAIDFEYDDCYLSDYGLIVCHFNNDKGTNVVDTGSKISFNKIPRNRGKLFDIIGSAYSESITCSFDICKNPDIFSPDKMQISSDEYRDLMRWLNRHEFHKFQIIDDSEPFKEACYFNASFNIEKVYIADRLCGLTLTMETDKPFGYGERQIFHHTGNNYSFVINDMNDEIGETFIDIDILCNEDCDISISNESIDTNRLIIKNCKKDELISIKGDSLLITSNQDTHDIASDFNYEFLKIRNTFDSRCNKITVNSPCDVTISYSPIIKDIPM